MGNQIIKSPLKGWQHAAKFCVSTGGLALLFKGFLLGWGLFGGGGGWLLLVENVKYFNNTRTISVFCAL